MIGFEQYSKIKNNYCLCYFGYSDEYLVQLRLLKPMLENHFTGLNICLGCKDDKTHLLKDSGPILKISRIKVERKSYAYIREVRFNGKTHPVEDLLVESGIKNLNTGLPIKERITSRCVIVSKGFQPTESLTTEQIKGLEKLAKEQGWEPEVDTDIENSDLVMGVESVSLFEAGAQGIPTKLYPTGLGTRLYKMLFSNGEVLHR